MSTGSIPSVPIVFRFTIPPALTPGQSAIVRAMQAGAVLAESRHEADTPTFRLVSATLDQPVTNSAMAALAAHGMIERGAQPVDQIPFYYRHDIYHWSLTAKGKEFV